MGRGVGGKKRGVETEEKNQNWGEEWGGKKRGVETEEKDQNREDVCDGEKRRVETSEKNRNSGEENRGGKCWKGIKSVMEINGRCKSRQRGN